jgi:hypothetical protein
MTPEAIEVLSVIAIQADIELPAGFADGTANLNRTITSLGQNWGHRLRWNKQTGGLTPSSILATEITLAGSTADVDLTSVAEIGAVDGGGEPTHQVSYANHKPMLVMFSTRFASGTTNTGSMNIAPKTGATGYEIFGVGITTGILLPPNSVRIMSMPTAPLTAVVAGGRRLLTLTGTSGDRLAIQMAMIADGDGGVSQAMITEDSIVMETQDGISMETE